MTETSGISSPRRAALLASGKIGYRLPLFLLWSILAGLATVLMWLDAIQLNGLVSPPDAFRLYYLPRLVPLFELMLAAVAFVALLRASGLDARARLALRRCHWRRAGSVLIAGGIVLGLAGVWLLRGFPNSGDEYNYLFEAKTFLAGRLWNPEPPVHELFAMYHQTLADGRWFGPYSPGWPLLLTGGLGLHLPSWVVCPLMGGVLLFAVWKIAERQQGQAAGVLAVALVALSPFFLFNAASFFDMVPAAAAGALFCWAAIEFLDRPRLSAAIAAGTALGVLGLIRSDDVVLFALPFAVEFLWRGRRWHYLYAGAIILSGLPFLIALLLYNDATLGSYLPFGHSSGSLLKFGLFPVDAHGHRFTPWDQLQLAGNRIIMLAEWSSPLLVIGYFVAFAGLARRRALSFLDFIFPSFVIAFLLVPFSGGNQYGPRYYFEGFPFLVLTVVSALTPLLRDEARPRRANLIFSLGLAHMAICFAGVIIFGLFFRQLVDQRMDVYARVHAAHLRNAVVVIRSPTAPIRPMMPRDLIRNGIALAGRPVLYVRDLPEQLTKLRRLYPDRRFYLYERNPFSVTGRLHRLW